MGPSLRDRNRESQFARVYDSAAFVRRCNANLDEALLALAQRVPERSLHDEFSEAPRTLAQQLGHLGEFCSFHSAQLEAWFDRRRVVVGRIADSDPDFHYGLTRATELRLASLLELIESSCRQLATTLQRLHDGHLRAVTHNVQFGREPLISYLDRCIIGHKLAHVAELETTLDGM